jgi:hypothetical protein
MTDRASRRLLLTIAAAYERLADRAMLHEHSRN